MEEIINKDCEFGKIIISEDVICTIAGIAASEVEGVEAMSGGIVGGIVEMIGKKSTGKGIKVEINENIVSLEVHIIAKYGSKLTEVCFEIQEKVKKAVETMCGMEVEKVNVYIESVFIEKEPKKSTKQPKEEPEEE